MVGVELGSAIFSGVSTIPGSLWIAFLVLIFLIKLPVYGVHLWLPKAHVEAPLPGSIMLAGVLLKLGIYGLIRFFNTSKALFFVGGSFIYSVGICGSFFCCILCLRQRDIKSLVAYSSVCHIGVCLSSLRRFNIFSYPGSLGIRFFHGVCSPLIFFLVYVLYNRLHSRRVVVLGGGLSITSLLGLVFFISSIINIRFPPSIGFFSEIFIIYSVISFNLLSSILISLVLFFTGVYCIYFYCMRVSGVSFYTSNWLLHREISTSFGGLLLTFLILFCVPFLFSCTYNSKNGGMWFHMVIR